MPDTFSPPIAPSYNSTNTTEEPKVLTAKFGNGYEQRTPDGTNNNPVSATLGFDSLTLAQADEIIDFCRDKGGSESFYYTFPDEGSARLIIASKWTKVWKQDGHYGVTMTVREVFDLV